MAGMFDKLLSKLIVLTLMTGAGLFHDDDV
jgi:hypothetical protein